MTLRRLVALGAVLAMLVSSGASANAEEAKMSALQTALSSTTISGYVDTSVERTPGIKDTVVQPVEEPAFECWWRVFRNWFRNLRGH